ncbi:gustatory and odorant receptor 24 [Asbolus verrucosus]|uniref:Gustatory receptor n=1 Tax=Asbolus verrucosus TaxID=1661398 RepID=A0A482WBA4_ASBVE|nr:gustatory and odorant receptor 24 [Asbolus verrucosus]
MYHQDMTTQVGILGEPLNQKPRRSVFLESALDSAQGPHTTKVAPAPVKFINKPTEAFELNKQRGGVIYETLKPIRFLMRIMGIFPIANTDTELRVFKMTPHWLGYSVIIFLLIVGYIGYVKWDTVEIVRSQEGRFEEAVIDYLFTVYLLPIVINPIVWYEGKKLASVVTELIYFERIYNKVTKKKMTIFFGNKPLIITVVLPVISCLTMVVTHVTMAHFKIIQVVPYCYINTIIYLVGGFWFIQCDVVGRVATLIADDFQTALKHVGPSTQVADYRSLWMLLSKIIRDIGNASGYALTFICLYFFLIITLTIYGLLSQLQAGFSSKDVGLAVNAALATAILFFICNEAHYASNSVRVQFQKKLLLVELSWKKNEVQHEINMFLRATEMSPTDMSLVGFFDVNRNLFKSLLATMVTYLVVLLQFQISIPEDIEGDTNSTSVISATTRAPK